MKKIFMTLAAAALVMASCSTNEETDFNSQNPNAIKFSSTTSRAAVSTITTLTGDTNGFKVYGTETGNTSTWYENVAGVNYKYTSSWGWAGTAATWPTDAAKYPMNFYAYHPATATGVNITPTAATAISGAITIQSTAATQYDLLAAKATANAKPSDATLPLTFNHILSKVNFGVIAGADAEVYVQSLRPNNAKNAGTYNYMTGSWGASTTGSADYDYFNSTTTPRTITQFTGTASEDAAPFYATGHSNNLMLMPQTATTAWNRSTPALALSTLATGAYFEVVYRLEQTDDQIGYGDATDFLTDYPAYVDGSDTWSTYTGIEEGATPYGNKPLFIKVGFPIEITWEAGKGYTYNICLGTAGSTNGYYVDDTYYDEDGNDTGIKIKGPDGEDEEIGDPVTGGTILFRVVVGTWDDQSDTSLDS